MSSPAYIDNHRQMVQNHVEGAGPRTLRYIFIRRTDERIEIENVHEGY